MKKLVKSKLTIEYDNRKDFKTDEDLRLKGIAFDRLNDYLRKIIRDSGAAGILAALEIKSRSKTSEDLVYKLSEHFRKHLNSVYEDSLEN